MASFQMDRGLPFLENREIEKRAAGKSFDPERYGLIFCDKCSGSGRCDDGGETVRVCEDCGGFGLIKKPGEAREMVADWVAK